jgi:hypothetical protein
MAQRSPKPRTRRNLTRPHYRIFRWAVPQWIALSGAIGALMVFIAGLLLWGFIRDERAESRRPDPVSTVPATESTPTAEPARPTLPRILDQHRQATGLASVNSLLFQGEIILEDGNAYACSLLIRRPDNIKQSVRNFRASAALSFNGQSYTATRNGQTMPSGDHPDRIDSVLNRHSLLLEGAFGQLAWDQAATTQEARLLGTETINGHHCHVVEKTFASRVPIRYYIDTASALVVARQLRFKDQGKTTELLIILEDFRTIDSLTLPMAYRLLRNGSPVVSASFEFLSPNAGLLPEAFQ